MGWRLGSSIAIALLAATPASAQRAPPVRMPPTMVRPIPVPIRPNAADTTAETLRRQAARRADAAADAEASRTREAVRERRVVIAQTYERDLQGRWFRRGEIVVATETAGLEAAAQALGLRELRRQPLPAAGLTLHTFAAPAGARAEAAVQALRALRPDDGVDLNFIYGFEATSRASGRVRPLAFAAEGGGSRLGAIIDGALPDRAPALAGVAVRTARFGPGQGQADGHALAVAAVLADTAGRDGLLLLAADVSEAGPLPGASAAAIAEALNWVASYRAPVVNISLTGPPNAALAAVVRKVAARGMTIVAAAGNDGPRAQPPYPAALPEVVAVTAVDGRMRIWRRATQGPHVDFAALGVKVAVAGGEWTGTSLAAPVVTGLLLRPGASPERLMQRARDLGDPGRDPVFGYGLVTADAGP